jgi:hypothetical protein
MELETAFQARHLAVSMAHAYALSPRLGATEAAATLRAHRFDQAPVIDSGHPIGFVLLRDVEDASTSTVQDVMTHLGSGNVVSGDASVGNLLEWILEPGFLFVIEGRNITGFITVFDFNKQPARAHLYLLLARLESSLADLVRIRFTDQLEALARVTDESRPRIQERYQADESAGQESELLAYFDFSDLLIVVHGDEALLAQVGYSSPGRWKRDTGGLVDLRHHVMHPVRNVVLTKGGLIKLHEREQRIRDLINTVESATRGMTT